MSARGAGEVPTRGAEAAGTEVEAATGTIGAVSEGADIDRTDAAAVGRADGAESWDGKRGGGTGSTFSDDADPRSGRRGVTSPRSCFIVRLASGVAMENAVPSLPLKDARFHESDKSLWTSKPEAKVLE